jgi:DNA polymerase III epsilon subunit-like protein
VRYLNYIIFDLEYNQIDNEVRRLAKVMKTKKPRYLKFEILQIGAVKVDKNFKYMSNFKMYVKPRFFPTVNKHVLNILGVSEEYIRINGLKFDRVFNEFKNFIGQDKCTFVTWSGSNNDINVLKSNLGAWNINFNINKYRHIDLQKLIMQKKGLKLFPSLEKTAIEYNINFDSSSLHDAYTDASITKQILQKIGVNEIKSYVEIKPTKKKIRNRYIEDKNLMKFNNTNMVYNEFKKTINCKKCGRFIKTLGKNNVHFINNDINIVSIDKFGICDKCKIYILKNYSYTINRNSLLIIDKIINKGNKDGIERIKKIFNNIEGIENL